MIIPSRTLTGANARRKPLRHVPQDENGDTYSNGIDWLAVHRAVSGEHPLPELTRAEQREAAICLSRNGIARLAISIRLGVYTRLVKEWEAEAGLLPDSDLCTHPNCRKPISGRKLCPNHLQQLQYRNREWAAALTDLEAAA